MVAHDPRPGINYYLRQTSWQANETLTGLTTNGSFGYTFCMCDLCSSVGTVTV